MFSRKSIGKLTKANEQHQAWPSVPAGEAAWPLASSVKRHLSADWRRKSPSGERLIGHTSDVNGVVFRPTAKTSASASADKTRDIVEVATHSLSEHN